MGKKVPRDPAPSETWVIHYRGGGPLDGKVATAANPITQHHIHVDDAEFIGHQIYERIHQDDAARLVVLSYKGEVWGPNLIPGDGSA